MDQMVVKIKYDTEDVSCFLSFSDWVLAKKPLKIKKKNNVYTKQVTWALIMLCRYPQGQSKF